jgi:hypothetical protein
MERGSAEGPVHSRNGSGQRCRRQQLARAAEVGWRTREGEGVRVTWLTGGVGAHRGPLAVVGCGREWEREAGR